MMITAEMMREHISRLSAQRDNALATFHQAVGAISLAEHLLSQIESGDEKDSLTLEEFASSLGAEGAEIIQLNNSTA